MRKGKKLNEMMREKRRKSGGLTGKSPNFNKKKGPEVTEDTKLGAEKKQYSASTMPSPIVKKESSLRI